ncbi:glycosyltransferase family 4 protein [Gymnodinialimonas sp. 2305UL16-5]|uniref:glycosyltransferase family 4 protein n=1 Tax=Gymnodinialimonas mytili TaxID=3126503 RepID=UPI0030B1730D
MKIAYVMSHRELNGVTASGTAQIRALLDRGHEMYLVHRPDAWIGAQTFEGPIHRYPIDMGGRSMNRPAITQLRDDLKAAGVEVVYSHGTQANRISALWRRQGAFPVLAKAAARIWHPHWRWQHIIISPGQPTADWLVVNWLARRKNIQVIPNFVRTGDIIRRSPDTRAEARQALGLDPDIFALVMVGTIDARKNQAAVVPLLAELARRGIPTKAVLIGSPGEAEVAKIHAGCAQAGLVDAVQLLGHRDDARRLLPAFDALVSTSLDEQAPVTVVEALATGLPVVSTPVGNVPFLIQTGVNGALINLSDPTEAVDYMQMLATDEDAVAAQSAAARATFDERLSEDDIVARIEDTFRIAIDRYKRR